jgi:hypothetical protein
VRVEGCRLELVERLTAPSTSLRPELVEGCATTGVVLSLSKGSALIASSGQAVRGLISWQVTRAVQTRSPASLASTIS